MNVEFMYIVVSLNYGTKLPQRGGNDQQQPPPSFARPPPKGIEGFDGECCGPNLMPFA